MAGLTNSSNSSGSGWVQPAEPWPWHSTSRHAIPSTHMPLAPRRAECWYRRAGPHPTGSGTMTVRPRMTSCAAAVEGRVAAGSANWPYCVMACRPAAGRIRLGRGAPARAVPALPPAQLRSSVSASPSSARPRPAPGCLRRSGRRTASRTDRPVHLEDALRGIRLLTEIHQLIGIGGRLPEYLAEQPQYLCDGTPLTAAGHAAQGPSPASSAARRGAGVSTRPCAAAAEPPATGDVGPGCGRNVRTGHRRGARCAAAADTGPGGRRSWR